MYEKTYIKLAEKGVISTLDFQQNEIYALKRKIVEQNKLKRDIITRIDIQLLLRGIRFNKKQSSAIKTMKMTDDNSITITFHSHPNDEYRYRIPTFKAVEWLESSSIGKYYNKHIKGGV